MARGKPKAKSSGKRAAPTFEAEAASWAEGYRCVAGLDEVGRGPIAGPVVAAAVVLYQPDADRPWFADLRDSKLLTALQRERLAASILREAVTWGIGVVSPQDIDGLGITKANRRALTLALQQCAVRPDCLLLDGREWVGLNIHQRSIIKGDRTVRSIAAASIIAKVHRDRIMSELEDTHPGWGFAQHKGYATAQHLAAVRTLGPSPVHRMSFAPIAGSGQARMPGLA
ncbi:MAG: ribonuclease HII [Dehalococcoidia bacterium]|nr:ribonuclease HII [Dehalococcoidia bacterium]